MEFHLSAYIQKCQTLDEVRHGLVLPVFAMDAERMEDAGFKRIGSAHVAIRLEDDIDAAIAGAGVGAVGVEA